MSEISSSTTTKLWPGDGFWSVKPTFHQIWFLLGFRSLYFENLEKLKLLVSSINETLTIAISGGTPPRILNRGGRVPLSPPPQRHRQWKLTQLRLAQFFPINLALRAFLYESTFPLIAHLWSVQVGIKPRNVGNHRQAAFNGMLRICKIHEIIIEQHSRSPNSCGNFHVQSLASTGLGSNFSS